MGLVHERNPLSHRSLIDPPEKVARRLGVTYDRFKASLPELERFGFPNPVNVLGNYCLQAVDNLLGYLQLYPLKDMPSVSWVERIRPISLEPHSEHLSLGTRSLCMEP